MKRTLNFFSACLLLISLMSDMPGFIQPDSSSSILKGAWEKKDASGNITTLICTEKYLMFASYSISGKKYLKSGGGPYQLSSANGTEIMSFTRDFNTEDSTKVGLTIANDYTLSGEKLVVPSGPLQGSWDKVKEPKGATVLTAVWRIISREGADGKMVKMMKGSRKTIKILSGSHFQWAAIDTDTKIFSGTGGGTYALKDGKYVETLDFFSKDNNRVGKNLSFSYTLNGKEWEHTGVSSTGSRVHEIWEKQE